MSYLTGSYEQAAESYAKAENLDPSLSEVGLTWATPLYYLDKYQASINAYNALLRLEPQNADALAGKSQALLALNKTVKRMYLPLRQARCKASKLRILAHQNTVEERLANQ